MRRGILLVTVLALATVTGCASSDETAPRCRADQRTGIVAQAVPTATYVPCVERLAPGWSVSSFDVRPGQARFALHSDRAEHDVTVRLRRECAIGRATPVAPRRDGVRTYVRVSGIVSEYRGDLLDVFPGGCVRYSFDFARGPHITLFDELTESVGLYPRRDLRRALRADLGIKLDP